MNLPKDGRTGLPFFAGINIRKYMMAIAGNLKSGIKKQNFKRKQSIKKYPSILIPTRFLGVSFCLESDPDA